LNGLRAARAAGIFTVVAANAITQHMQLDEADLLVRSFEDVKLDDLFALIQLRKI
jgi:beta-phosphoglucomutase-like phosphatase (HAD superfamily)